VLVLDEMRKAVWEATTLEQTAEALRAHEVQLHVLSSNRAPADARAAFDRLSQATAGMSLSARTLEDTMGNARDLLESLYGGYRLRIPVGGEGRRRVEVHEAEYEGHAEWHWRNQATAA
jgi:hypothetical protein